MTTKEIDKKFEKMSRQAVEKMNGTHPTKKTTQPKKTTNKRGK